MAKYRWLIEPIVATCCCVAVLLVTAGTPSQDEVARGVPAALAAWFFGRLTQRGA